jgi:hypothetical protein
MQSILGKILLKCSNESRRIHLDRRSSLVLAKLQYVTSREVIMSRTKKSLLVAVNSKRDEFSLIKIDSSYCQGATIGPSGISHGG